MQSPFLQFASKSDNNYYLFLCFILEVEEQEEQEQNYLQIGQFRE